MAFSNRIKKTVKLISSVVKTNGCSYSGPLRLPYVGRNSVWNGNSDSNSVNNSITWKNKYFGSFTHDHDGDLHGGCKMKTAKLIDSVCNDVGEDEEEDVDLDFLLCNEKLCKDNENGYVTFIFNFFLRSMYRWLVLFFLFCCWFCQINSVEPMRVNVGKRRLDNDSGDGSSSVCYPDSKKRRLIQCEQPGMVESHNDQETNVVSHSISRKRVFDEKNCFEPLIKRQRLNDGKTNDGTWEIMKEVTNNFNCQSQKNSKYTQNDNVVLSPQEKEQKKNKHEQDKDIRSTDEEAEEEEDFDILDLVQQQQQQPNDAPTAKKITKSILEMKDVLISMSSFLSLFDIIKMRRISSFLRDEFDFKFGCKNYCIYFEYKNIFIVDIIKEQICQSFEQLSMYFLQLQNYSMASFCFNVCGNRNIDKSKNISSSGDKEFNTKYLTRYYCENLPSLEITETNNINCKNCDLMANNFTTVGASPPKIDVCARRQKFGSLLRKSVINTDDKECQLVTMTQGISSPCYFCNGNDILKCDCKSLFLGICNGNCINIPIFKFLKLHITSIDNQIDTLTFDVNNTTVMLFVVFCFGWKCVVLF